MTITKENIQPVGERCLIDIYQGAKETAGGIILSDDTQATTPILGTVVSAGDSSRFKVGDLLLFRRYALDELKYRDEQGNKSIYIIEDQEVLGLLTQ